MFGPENDLGQKLKYLKHRVCLSCLSTDIFEIHETGEIFCFTWIDGDEYDEGSWIKGDCESQTKKQGVLTKDQWKYFVDKGAPDFYLRDITEVCSEVIENDIRYIDIFRINNAHPYEAKMPDSLRDTCFILYDQIRSEIMTMSKGKKNGNEGAGVFIDDLTARAYQWSLDLCLEKITEAQLSLFFFEIGDRPDRNVSKKMLKRINEKLCD